MNLKKNAKKEIRMQIAEWKKPEWQQGRRKADKKLNGKDDKG